VVRDKYPILVQALLSVASPQLKAMGTLGGNLCQDNLCVYYNRSPMSRQALKPCHKLGGKICHAVRGSKTCWATYCGDVAPALLALQAKVKIVGPGSQKVIPLQKFYTADGKKPNILKPGEILTEIQVPPPRFRSGGAYLKLRIRRAIDYPLLGAAFWHSLRNGQEICDEANLALTGVERAPLLIQEAEALKGKRLEGKIIEDLAEAAYRRAHPLQTVCELTPKYRKDMVRVYVKEAVRLAIQQASKGGVL
jgi:4-hydroxybenzoyl-CoA reductase subunit beta